MDLKLEIPESVEDGICVEDLKTRVPCRDEFFLARMLTIMETETGGPVSTSHLNEFLSKLTNSNDEMKIDFLFSVYDINGDGSLEETNFREIIKSCVRESGLELDQDDLHILAGSLFRDGLREGRERMTLEDFKGQLRRHSLHEGLDIMIRNWLTQSSRPARSNSILQRISEMKRKYLCAEYWSSNSNLQGSLLVILLVNIILFTHRAYHFKDFTSLSGLTPNPFYLLSRACGRVLMFNSVLVLALVLRNTITILRRFGLASVLPLDHNIYLHKLVGIMIFLQGLLHSLMHLANFYINIQPNPIKFFQLTYSYWTECYGDRPILEMYRPPPGCYIVTRHNSSASFCPPGSFHIPPGVSREVLYNRGEFLCQTCPSQARPWTCADWILTKQPRVFGKLGGEANPSGVMLMIILLVIFLFSLPCVRRRGHFGTFYYTHMLYWAYFFCLLLHAEQFWKWISLVGVIWLVEICYRTLNYMYGQGRTVIRTAELLPSRVTHLRVERPPTFQFSPGDWVFVKIPAVASTEWHPFTISSCPELTDQFSLHVRGVGQWTNSLYNILEAELLKQTQSSPFRRGGRSRKIREQAETRLERPLEIYVDGPFGSPASNIYRAEHAVLIGTGIGVTPFASILQSIMFRYWERRRRCRDCQHSQHGDSIFNLKKVDFFWINRDQRSFEWFIELLSQLETEQREKGGSMRRFLDMNMYLTSAPNKTDMKVVALQLALNILYNRKEVEPVEGLGCGVRAGRPDWSEVLGRISREARGEVTVFYCGTPALANTLRAECQQRGFRFSKEVF